MRYEHPNVERLIELKIQGYSNTNFLVPLKKKCKSISFIQYTLLLLQYGLAVDTSAAEIKNEW